MDAKVGDNIGGGCPVAHGGARRRADPRRRGNRDWWPENLRIEGAQPGIVPRADPMGKEFDYAAAFETLDLECRDRRPAQA